MSFCSKESLWNELENRSQQTVHGRVWNMVIVAVLWSIWLARNENSFQKVNIFKSSLQRVIQIRAFKWAVANEWLNVSMENLWIENPKGAILKFFYLENLKCWDEIHLNSELVASIDGSWSSSASGGIGEIIKDRNKKVIYLFSNHVSVNSSFEAEVEALKHVLIVRKLQPRLQNK